MSLPPLSNIGQICVGNQSKDWHRAATSLVVTIDAQQRHSHPPRRGRAMLHCCRCLSQGHSRPPTMGQLESHHCTAPKSAQRLCKKSDTSPQREAGGCWWCRGAVEESRHLRRKQRRGIHRPNWCAFLHVVGSLHQLDRFRTRPHLMLTVDMQTVETESLPVLQTIPSYDLESVYNASRLTYLSEQ